jgi:hypothetical protein
MTLKPLKNPAASIRQRLLNHAKANGDDYQRILVRYAIERLLFRISRSEVRDQYTLKGAMLLVTWPQHAFRPTGDLDLLGQGDPNPDAIATLFAAICQIEEPADGILFDPASLRVEAMRADEAYSGVRMMVTGLLDGAKPVVQIDIGFGDKVYPEAKREVFPNLLPDLPAATILMYPPETVVAEKFEAMIRFGETNGRIKDFHDIWVAARTFPFDLGNLTEAVRGTFERRKTEPPVELPIVLLPAFGERASTQRLWTGFLRRNPPTLEPPPFDRVLDELRRFLNPVLGALASPGARQGRWNPDRSAWERATET